MRHFNRLLSEIKKDSDSPVLEVKLSKLDTSSEPKEYVHKHLFAMNARKVEFLPITFGDLNYYWVFCCAISLTEKGLFTKCQALHSFERHSN